MENKIEAQKKAGAEFLQANKNKAGVVALPEGLQYEDIETGQWRKAVFK